jgi:hypothetical protein
VKMAQANRHAQKNGKRNQALSCFTGRQDIVIRRAFSHAAAKTCTPMKMAQANRHAQKNGKATKRSTIAISFGSTTNYCTLPRLCSARSIRVAPVENYSQMRRQVASQDPAPQAGRGH